MRSVLLLTVAGGIIAGFGLGLAWFDASRGRGTSALPTRTLTLAFQAHSVATRLLGKGWSTPESWGVWSIGPRAELAVPIRERLEGDVDISIEAKAFIMAAQLESQEVIVEVNGSEIAKLNYSKADSQRSLRLITVPKEVATRSNPIRIAFKVLNPKSPAEIGLSNDARKLGIGLLELRLSFPSPEVYLE